MEHPLSWLGAAVLCVFVALTFEPVAPFFLLLFAVCLCGFWWRIESE